jgi:hypothetical protein
MAVAVVSVEAALPELAPFINLALQKSLRVEL